jgi:hypothetical protein
MKPQPLPDLLSVVFDQDLAMTNIDTDEIQFHEVSLAEPNFNFDSQLWSHPMLALFQPPPEPDADRVNRVD